MLNMKCIGLILYVTTCFSLGCSEKVTNTTYNVEFDENLNQWIVRHPETGAIWLRCDIGKEWNPDKQICVGDATPTTLQGSQAACPDGFTLPSNADFATILCNYSTSRPACLGYAGYDSCETCSTCNNMFPDIGDKSYSASYFSSDFYWIEEVESYHCFNFELWGENSCVFEYNVPEESEKNEKKNIKCILESDSLIDEQ